jgi:hypothetical protein
VRSYYPLEYEHYALIAVWSGECSGVELFDAAAECIADALIGNSEDAAAVSLGSPVVAAVELVELADRQYVQIQIDVIAHLNHFGLPYIDCREGDHCP